MEYTWNIHNKTDRNLDFRRVVGTTDQQQLIVMCITNDDEGFEVEVPSNATQFIRIESGHGEVVFGEKTLKLGEGSALMMPPGTRYEIMRRGVEWMPLHLFMIYSPPQYEASLVEDRRRK